MTAPYSPPAKPTALTRPSRSTVRCGSISIARSPTVTEPSGAIATTLGTSALPVSPSAITRGSPASMAAMRLLVVPRSMPKIRGILACHAAFGILERSIDVANQSAQVRDVGKDRFQFQRKHSFVGRIVPLREQDFELGEPFVHRELKLNAARRDLGCEFVRGLGIGSQLHLGQLLLHVEDQLGDFGRHALVVVGELFAVELDPVEAARDRIAQRAIAAR